jgi:hypothetical protein
VRKACIAEHGVLYNYPNEKEFELKLKFLLKNNKQISILDVEIRTSIQKAIDGEDPCITIQKDDPNLS